MNQATIHRPSNSNWPTAKYRSAFLLIEMLSCFVFLSIAAGILVNLHRSRLEYDRKAVQHLRTQLMLENVGERLKVMPFDQLDDAVVDLRDEYPVRIKVAEFQSGSTGGFHAVLEPALESSTTLQHHIWRLEPSR